LTGFTHSTGSIDLTAHAAIILAIAPQVFIGFRVLIVSAWERAAEAQ
jgi:hypothetical protein